MAGKFELKNQRRAVYVQLKASMAGDFDQRAVTKTKPSAENGIESVRKNSAREAPSR